MLGASRHSALLAGVLLALFGAAGCGPTCDTSGQAPIRYTGGITRGTFYMTTDWEGPWLYFPPGRTYDLVHGLKNVATTEAFVAFSATPLPTNHDEDGNMSESPGNQTVFEQVNDDFIRVRNDTCSDFYLLVTAQGMAASDAGLDANSE
jgi:hypothetical protein